MTASEKEADRATPWWRGVRLKSWPVAVGVAVFGASAVWASQSVRLWPSEAVSGTRAPAAAVDTRKKVPNASAPNVSAVPGATAVLPMAEAAVSDVPANSALVTPAPSPGAKRAPGEISDELSGLEAARAAQQRGDHAGALRSIEAHERRFPRSIFVEEREALRVSALGKLGRTTEARARARAFANRYPRSVFVSKLSPWLTD